MVVEERLDDDLSYVLQAMKAEASATFATPEASNVITDAFAFPVQFIEITHVIGAGD